MRRLLSLLFLVPLFLPGQQPGSLTGKWIVSADFYGTSLFLTMELEQQGGKLTGKFDGDKLEGTLTGDALRFLAKDDQGGSEDVKATVQGDTIIGTAVFVDGSNPSKPVTRQFTAKLVPARRQ